MLKLVGSSPSSQIALIKQFIQNKENQDKINKIVNQNAVIPSNWKANSILGFLVAHWIVCIALFSVLIHSAAHSELRNVFIIMLTFSLAIFIVVASLVFGVYQGYLDNRFIGFLVILFLGAYIACGLALRDRLKSVKAVFDPPNSVKSLSEYTQLPPETQKMCDAAVYLFTIGMYVTIGIPILRFFYEMLQEDNDL